MRRPSRVSIFLISSGLGLLVTAGCSTPDTTNTKKNRDEYALMETKARQHQKSDGNLSADYLVDTLLNGSGKNTAKPAIDQPLGPGPDR